MPHSNLIVLWVCLNILIYQEGITNIQFFQPNWDRWQQQTSTQLLLTPGSFWCFHAHEMRGIYQNPRNTCRAKNDHGSTPITRRTEGVRPVPSKARGSRSPSWPSKPNIFNSLQRLLQLHWLPKILKKRKSLFEKSEGF